MIEIKELYKKYIGALALRGVELTIGEGEIIGIFGENGAGYFRLTAFGSYENTLKACGFFKTL